MVYRQAPKENKRVIPRANTHVSKKTWKCALISTMESPTLQVKTKFLESLFHLSRLADKHSLSWAQAPVFFRCLGLSSLDWQTDMATVKYKLLTQKIFPFPFGAYSSSVLHVGLETGNAKISKSLSSYLKYSQRLRQTFFHPQRIQESLG